MIFIYAQYAYYDNYQSKLSVSHMSISRICMVIIS